MRLLLNADDLGYTPLINQAIFELHQQERLFSTSLLVNLPHSQDAIDGLSAYPNLAVGLHLNLTKGRPLLPTHLDSHSHWHVLPHLQQLVLRLAKRYQIPGIRQASLRRTLLPSALWLDAVPTKKQRHPEFSIPDYLLSLHHWIGSNGMPQHLFFSDGFQRLVSRPDITLEMVTHPGKADDPDFPPDSLTAQRRHLEYDFLLSARFGEWLEATKAVCSSDKGL